MPIWDILLEFSRGMPARWHHLPLACIHAETQNDIYPTSAHSDMCASAWMAWGGKMLGISHDYRMSHASTTYSSFMRQISVKQGAQSTVGGERQVKVEVVGPRLS